MIHQTVNYLNGLLEVLGIATTYHAVTELETVEIGKATKEPCL